MASLKERATDALARLRERRPAVDHVVRMQEHYGQVGASQQAGAVTYFGFLSVFPILALAVFVVGYVARVLPDAQQTLVLAVDGVLPGLIGTDEGQISLDSVQQFSGLAGVVGLLGVAYAGLGWVSALRDALELVFEKPQGQQPGFVAGKLRDLLTLVVIGGILLVAVAVTGVVSTGSSAVLDWLGLGEDLEWLVKLVSVALGLAANTLLFFAMFELLASPRAPRGAVVRGALLGAVGFEVLKQLSSYLLAGTRSQPAFQAFGIALILVVWINYFSRVVLYAASFAHTAPATRELLERDAAQVTVVPAHLSAAATDPASEVLPINAEPPEPDPAPGRHARRDAEPDRAPELGSWREGFVEAIDAADPDDVGEASARAAEQARAQRDADAARHRLMALGAAGSAAGLAALTALRRRIR